MFTYDVKKTVNTTGLTAIPCKVGLWLACGDLIFENVPNTLTNRSDSLCLNCLYEVRGLCQTSVSFWEPAILVHVRQKLVR